MRTAERLSTPRAGAVAASCVYDLRRREAVYRWFAELCVRSGHRRVLDAGSGDGYGTAILAAAGLDVTGVDLDPAAVAVAERRYRFGRITFRVQDACATGLDSEAFDAVLACRLIEHVPDAQALCAEVVRLSRSTVVIATPNRLTASPGRTRPVAGDRIWEFTPDELGNLLTWRFPEHRMLGVHHGRRLRTIERLAGEPLAPLLGRVPPCDRAFWLRRTVGRLRASDLVVGPGVAREALDLVAVASA